MDNNFYITSRNTGKEYTMQVLFARNTKAQLLEKIVGSVQTYLTDDSLVVNIYGANDIVFRYTLNNLTHAIVQGFTSERLVQIIYKRYRQYIENLFFL